MIVRFEFVGRGKEGFDEVDMDAAEIAALCAIPMRQEFTFNGNRAFMHGREFEVRTPEHPNQLYGVKGEVLLRVRGFLE